MHCLALLLMMMLLVLPLLLYRVFANKKCTKEQWEICGRQLKNRALYFLRNQRF
jgi:hypothetical protein